jgi:hypothetical protein
MTWAPVSFDLTMRSNLFAAMLIYLLAYDLDRPRGAEAIAL